MAEYIEREAVISAIKKYEIENCPEYMQDWVTKLKEAVLGDITDIVLELPAADMSPVAYGEWVDNGEGGYKWAFICSECGWSDGYPFSDRHRFCPSCGAKMQEVR